MSFLTLRAAGVAASIVLVLAPGIAEAKFGALAFSKSDGASASSYAQPTRGAAEDAAVDACSEYGDDCRTVIWFRSSCAALAVGEGRGSGWASRPTRREAERAALSNCRDNTDGCRVVRWACSG